MKKINVNEIPISLIVFLGILASALSFVYYFVLHHPYESVYWLICIIDLSLFILNAYRLGEPIVSTKVGALLSTSIAMLAFFVFCEVAAIWLFDLNFNEITLEQVFGVFRIVLFLSPCLILLIPLIRFLCEVMS